jgi:signal transduction histidine kinase
MRHVVILLTVIFCWQAQTLAQQNLADSMEHILKQDLSDSARANALLFRAMYYEQVDTTKAHQHYQEAREFAIQKGQNYFISKTYQFEGFLYNMQGNSLKAIDLLKKALPFVENKTDKTNRLLYIKELTNISTYCLDAGDTKNALKYIYLSVTTAEQLGTVRVVDYLNIANIYQRMDEPVGQEKYVFKALSLAKEHQSEVEIFQSYIFISLYYTNAKNYPVAKIYMDTARFFHYVSFGDLAQKTSADLAYNTYQGFYLAAATAFVNINMDDSAIIFYNKALELANEHHSSRDVVQPKVRLGYIWLKKKNYAQADNILLEALKDAKANDDLKAVSDVTEFLSEVYAATGSFQKAYEFYKQFHIANDSITGLEKKKFTKELDVKYETEKKEALLQLQTATIKQERLIKYILIGVLALLLFLGIVAQRAYRNRQKLLISQKELQQQKIIQLENEKQLTATQAVVQGQEEERSRLAKDLHDGLGGILSSAKYSFNNMKQHFILTEDNAMAFEKSMSMLDASIAELRRVAHNMMPESLMKLSLNEALQDYCQQVSSSGVLDIAYQSFGMENLAVDNTIKITVYRIIQELTNNIIKHAAASKSLVQVIAKEDMLNITVEDDGKGFDVNALQHAAGIGYKNTLSRTTFLNGRLDVRSKPGEGTSVYIEIPLAK